MKQRIIKTLIVILFGLLLSVKVVAAEEDPWVPTWVSSQKNVVVYDITGDIKKAIDEVYSLFEFEGHHCYLAIDPDAKVDGKNFVEGNEDDGIWHIFLPIQLYCTQGIKYGVFYMDGMDEFPEYRIFNKSGGFISITFGWGEDQKKASFETPNAIEEMEPEKIFTEEINDNFEKFYNPEEDIEILNPLPGVLYVNLNNSKPPDGTRWHVPFVNFKASFFDSMDNEINGETGIYNLFGKYTWPEKINPLSISEDSPKCEYKIKIGASSCSIKVSLITIKYSNLPFEKVTFEGCSLDELSGNKNNFIKINKIRVEDLSYVISSYDCGSFYTDGRYWSDSTFQGATEVTTKGTVNIGNNSSTIPPRPNQSGGFISCSDIDVDKIKACGCIPAGVADITSKIYFILRIVGPVLLLILGGFDMAKAVASQDESSIEKAKKKLVNKFIAAAAIFFVLTIMEFVVGILAKNAGDILECIHILLDGYVI